MIENLYPALRRHLEAWLGRWPPAAPLDVVGAPQREHPGWDGRVFTLIGVRTPAAAVVSVPPAYAEPVRQRAQRVRLGDPDAWSALLSALPGLVEQPDSIVYSGIFRWCERAADLPDAGEWIPADAASVPQWLRPFGHEVLIATDPATGEYLAGVGIKHHDRYGQEIAVGTQPQAQGRGLARRLVAQAARRILAEGAVPTYQHDPANIASAKVADAAGFPDRGWRSLGLFRAPPG